MIENASIIRVNDKDFKRQVIESSLPVVVVFERNCWGTTHLMHPIIENIASEFVNKVKVFKYDLDENSAISDFYRIENNITILIFNEGNIVNRTGVISREEFKNIINTCLNNSVKHGLI